MDKINFQNLPSTETPINAENLNEMQDNVETAIKETQTTSKVLEVTDEKYGIRVRVFKCGKTITINLYADTWGEELASGYVGYTLATLTSDCVPIQAFTENIFTSLKNVFNVQVGADGTIKIVSNYQTIAANSSNKIAQNIVFTAA